MSKKLLTALACSALLMGLAACTSNETASTSNDSKAEEKAQKEADKEAEKAQKAEEKARVKKEKEEQKTAEKAQKEQEKQEKEEAKKAKGLEDKLNKAVNKKFGKDKVESIQINDNLGTDDPNDKIVLVTAEAKESATQNYTRKGMWMDTISILKDIKDEKQISEITFFYKYPLVDAYGNEKKDNVMKLQFNRETLDKINYSNLLHDNLPKIANEYWEHPALTKK
ncbi:hypothetical protein RE433_29100 (plasmid) [Bacillus cereus]|uniref:hypothetical protein n=1 Tax=Bacillus cereus TaxID=1396 RepID=UPI002867E42B|nr:hypothetical protein [Bacillus cereus]WMW41394.1 hypothetical protein RE433_29100 [Bacillus cereus]